MAVSVSVSSVDAKVTKQMNGLAGATFKNVDDSKKLKLEKKILNQIFLTISKLKDSNILKIADRCY
jgi:hypothetical protein